MVGNGWAGLAAAVTLADWAEVTVFEAGRVLGGRARRLARAPDGVFDNGQHLLLGAYSECLRLMRRVGAAPEALLAHAAAAGHRRRAQLCHAALAGAAESAGRLAGLARRAHRANAGVGCAPYWPCARKALPRRQANRGRLAAPAGAVSLADAHILGSR